MRFALRLFLLLFVTLGFVAPGLAHVAPARTAVASKPPCPSKPVLKTCVAPDFASTMPRTGASVDAPCHAKAVETKVAETTPRRVAAVLAYARHETTGSGWTGRPDHPPPRS